MHVCTLIDEGGQPAAEWLKSSRSFVSVSLSESLKLSLLSDSDSDRERSEGFFVGRGRGMEFASAILSFSCPAETDILMAVSLLTPLVRVPMLLFFTTRPDFPLSRRGNVDDITFLLGFSITLSFALTVQKGELEVHRSSMLMGVQSST